MNTLKRLGLVAAIAAGLVVRPAFAQTCAPSTDSTSVILLAHMRHVVTSTFAQDSVERVRNKIPSVAPSTITVVTTNHVCQKALAGFVSAFPGVAPAPTKVAVVKVGTVYVVCFPLADGGGWPHAVLDSKYAVLAKFML
jgi:hypothetical protein